MASKPHLITRVVELKLAYRRRGPTAVVRSTNSCPQGRLGQCAVKQEDLFEAMSPGYV